MARSKTFADGEILTPADVNDHLVNHVPSPGVVYDTGWMDVTAAEGFTTPIPVQVRRVGCTVYWRGSVGRTAGWTTDYEVAIPAANIPAGVSSANLAMLLNAGGTGSAGAATLTSAGLSLACATSTANINLASISYLVG